MSRGKKVRNCTNNGSGIGGDILVLYGESSYSEKEEEEEEEEDGNGRGKSGDASLINIEAEKMAIEDASK